MNVELKTGRKPFTPDDRDLQAANYTAGMPSPPAKYSVAPRSKSWPMFLNDSIGDCTVAGLAHLVQAWVAAVTGRRPHISNDVVLKFYELVSGYVPGDESTDQGANMRDVLRAWSKVGFDDHAITAFARVAAPDQDKNELVDSGKLSQSLWAFGGLYLGLNLPLSAQDQINQGEVWDVVHSERGTAGSWGGHAVNGIGYDQGGLYVITWGRRQYMTTAFITTYVDEAWAIISPDWLGAGKTPDGFDLAALESDLAALRA